MASYKVRLYITSEGICDVTVNAETEEDAITQAEQVYEDEVVLIQYEEITDTEILAVVNDDGEIQS